MSDFTLSLHGSLALLRPNTQAARDWCSEHLPAERLMMGETTAIEHRFVEDIHAGVTNDGLTVEVQ